MKTVLPLLLLLLSLPGHAWCQNQPATADSATVSAEVGRDSGKIVVEARGVQPEVAPFYSATARQIVEVADDFIGTQIDLDVKLLQGTPKTLSFAILGQGEIRDVAGGGLRDWSVRSTMEGGTEKRFLDLRIFPPPTRLKESKDYQITVIGELKKPTVPGEVTVLLLGAGESVGFASQIEINNEGSVEVRVAKAEGLLSVGKTPLVFTADGEPSLALQLFRKGASPADAELVNAQLIGKVREESNSVDLRLVAEGRAKVVNTRLKVLSGKAAITGATSGEGWHLELQPETESYEIVFDKLGNFQIDLSFVASIQEDGDWRILDFAMPAGAVVPLTLVGLDSGVSFQPTGTVLPEQTPEGWKGFLPATGTVKLAWKKNQEAGEGSLFFTSTEQSDVRVGAGLLRQTSGIYFRILQGKLNSIDIAIQGPGEILGVEGANLLGWKVVENGGKRVLAVRFSRPLEKEGVLAVQSQIPLGAFPAKAEAIRLTPEGGVRHSGFVRIANEGAVRLKIAEAKGMMQLAPDQFPGGPLQNPDLQQFIYRFPSAEYDYQILATQILAEVGVSQILTYELAESDLVIQAELELDIREAPLREWSLSIPADYAVVSLQGADVADYAPESTPQQDSRVVKILFKQAVLGRQLITLRLEKNRAAAAGEWKLPPISYPGAKSVRGHVGVVSVPGFRIVPGATSHLVETPLSYFPKQLPGLQQSFRIREPGWSGMMKIEALGQSIQTDIYHLYSLKEGIVYGSVLINYFVVGAPASEWRIEAPEAIGNIEVVGQNVRRDWRREGNQIIVSLHQPVLGSATLLVTFEQPMSARGGVINPGEIRPMGVQSERGFIQVVSPLQVKSEITKTTGLLKLDPLELPAEYRLLTSSPSLAAYQYTARPLELKMKIQWYDPANTVDQVVDFAKLSSQVSREGQIVTDARFFVKTRGRKALRVVLPSGVKLWEAKAGGEIVTARADGEQTLIPLPPRNNPNDAVEVILRLGQESKNPEALQLVSPKMLSPTVISEWVLSSDPERQLVPKGGTAVLTRKSVTETGFEWIGNRAIPSTLALLLATLLAAALCRAEQRSFRHFGLVVAFGAGFLAFVCTLQSFGARQRNLSQLTYSSSVIPSGEVVTIQLGNVDAWRAMISGWGIALGVLGLILMLHGWAKQRWDQGAPAWQAPLGAILLTSGLLFQRGGAVLFYLMIGLMIAFLIMVPLWRRPKQVPPVQPIAAMVFLLLGFLTLLTPKSHAADPGEERKPESIIQTWKIVKERLQGELTLTVRAKVGESFLLLRQPAVLTQFACEGARITKVERDGAVSYYLIPEREGLLTAKAKFESPADLANGMPLPTTEAVKQEVNVLLDQGGWEFTSPAAVRVLPTSGLSAQESGATLVLSPSSQTLIQVRPLQRKASSEATQFYGELSNLFIPGPGVVNGLTRVKIRPARGQVSELVLETPKGFTVGDVRNGPVGEWRFDPKSNKLRIAIEPAQSTPFQVDIDTQLGTATLPVDLTLSPLKLVGSAGEVGMIGLAFGSDAQPEKVTSSELTGINLEDFDSSLLPKGTSGAPSALLQQAFRYGQQGGEVKLTVTAVAPEVRVSSKQVLSIGDDRMLLVADLNVSITRAGLFNLSFLVPPGLEIESLTGQSLSHWVESGKEGNRLVTMILNGRTIGEKSFALTLQGPAPQAQAAWEVPRFSIQEATRQTGEIFLVPEKGIRLRAVNRENVSQLDPRAAGDTRPGTLAFRLLQENWNLKLSVEALEPWVTVQSLQEITLREGQSLTRLNLRYRVENAAVKHLKIRLPGLTEGQAKTVRGSGSAVSDLVQVAGSPDLWEIRFQRGIAGETDVQIEFQSETAQDQGKEVVQTPGYEGTRQITQFVVVRGGGRLELEAPNLPRGWQRIDWSAVPTFLQERGDRSVPTLSFRVAEPEAPLAVTVRRHDIAGALKLRVKQGQLSTIFSPSGPYLASVELHLEVLENSAMRVSLPKEAQLFSVFVNGESVSVVREVDAYLFNVSPTSEAERTALVRLLYASPGDQKKGIQLIGPSFTVPLENVSWRVVLPPGYELGKYKGQLRLQEERAFGSYSLDDYLSLSSSSQKSEKQKAAGFIDKANKLLNQGEQQQASEWLSKAARANVLDEASNEDARVQLRTLKTQQAVVGLNTRRQKLYLDNRFNDTKFNEQLEQAASRNPLMQGKTNFDPKQVDQLLLGNTAEENSALRGIAARLVDQQLATEPAPNAIDVQLPERGKVVTFTRSIQVEGNAPLTLDLKLLETRRSNGWMIFFCFVAVAVVVRLSRR